MKKGKGDVLLGYIYVFVTQHLLLSAVGKEIDGLEDSVIMRSLQALAVPLIGNACHIFMHGLNTVQVWQLNGITCPQLFKGALLLSSVV
jgi:hypothetical protein